MNADWAKGRNERTGLEGIFPRSYVAIVDEKKNMPPPPPTQSSYGNMPVDVSQSGSSGAPQKESKLNANGKKFGKKMGNAGTLTKDIGVMIGNWTREANLLYSYLWCWRHDRLQYRERHLLKRHIERIARNGQRGCMRRSS